jgi:hypothetical protein
MSYYAYPPFGVPILLVYRECPCGRWCATGEGAHHPVCENCGGYYVPGGGPHREPDTSEGPGETPMYGPIDGDGREARRYRGLGFRGELGLEIPLAERISRDLRETALLDDHGPAEERFHSHANTKRHYGDEETQRKSEQIKRLERGSPRT